MLLSDFEENRKMLTNCSKKLRMFSFTTISSVGVALFYAKVLADGQMDRQAYVARLKVAFRACFANTRRT
jgi:hypothetical protein